MKKPHPPRTDRDPGKPPDTYPKGRRCKTCRCFVSMYNPNDRCWLHHVPPPQEFVADALSAFDRTVLAAMSFSLADKVAA